MGVVVAVIDRQIAFRAPSEAEHVGAVGFPVAHCSAGDRIMVADHATDGGPALRALPSTGGHRPIARAGHVGHRNIARSGSTVVIAIEVVAGVDVRLPVAIGQHEGVGQQVCGAFLVGQGRATFSVPVGHENRGLVGAHPIRAADFGQTPALIGDVTGESHCKMVGEVEFRDLAGAEIVGGLDLRGLGCAADDLLLEEDAISITTRLLSQKGFYRRHVGAGDMLHRIDAEAIDAKFKQAVEVVGDFLLDFRLASVQIHQSTQAAVLHVAGVAVVADIARA